MVVVMNDKKHVGLFNVGNPSTFTMLDMGSKVKEATGSKPEIVLKENIVDDLKCKKPDITKIKSLI